MLSILIKKNKTVPLPTTPSSIFFKLLTFNLQLCPTSVFILEFHTTVKYSGAICVRASAMATPSDSSGITKES